MVFYFFCIFITWFALTMFQLQQHVVWTIIHIAHAIFTFLGFHYFRGTANYLDENTEYADKDWWTQLDAGVSWTARKRLLTMIPVVLFLYTQYVMYTFFDAAEENREDYYKLLVPNVCAFALVMYPKVFCNTKTHYS